MTAAETAGQKELNPVKDKAKATRKDATKKLKSVKVRPLQEAVAAQAANVKENAENVETLQFAVGDVQSLNKAIREEERRIMKAQKSVMDMFVTKTLCTACAWLTQALITKTLNVILFGPESKTFIISMIYAALIGVFVPILQDLLARKAPVKRSRLTSMVLLQKKALPMTIAWANKSAVADIVDNFDSTLLANVLVSLVMTLVVTALLHLPPVEKAQAARRKGHHGILCRYLCWPASLLLALGYVYNNVATWFVTALTDQFSELSTGAQYIIITIVQSLYFAIMAFTVTRLDAYWSNKRLRIVQKKIDEGNAGEDDHAEHADLSDIAHSIEREIETDIGDTMQKAVAFVYAWGLSNTLNYIYYKFFMNLDTYASGSYQQGWYFALGCSVILIWGTKQLSVTRYKSPASQSYKKLMINAMACTLGWSYMNVMSLTTGYFAGQLTASWGSQHGWSDALCYVIMFFLVQAICCEIFFQIQDEFHIHERDVSEFHEAYPTELPDEFEDLDGDGVNDLVVSPHSSAAREGEV